MNHKDYNIINLEFKGTKAPRHIVEFVGNHHVMDEPYYDARNILDSEEVTEPVAQANGKLIEVAPDLLEACDDLLQYWLGTFGESYVTEAAQVAISKAVGKPYAEIAKVKTDCINETISNFDLLNNKLQHACNLMNQMYDEFYHLGAGIDLTDVEDFLRENNKNVKPVKDIENDDFELPF